MRDHIDHDTIIDYLVEVVTDLTSTREEIEDTLKDYLNEYDNNKSKDRTDAVVDKLMEALGFEKEEKRAAVKKLDAPITIGNSLRSMRWFFEPKLLTPSRPLILNLATPTKSLSAVLRMVEIKSKKRLASPSKSSLTTLGTPILLRARLP